MTHPTAWSYEVWLGFGKRTSCVSPGTVLRDWEIPRKISFSILCITDADIPRKWMKHRWCGDVCSQHTKMTCVSFVLMVLYLAAYRNAKQTTTFSWTMCPRYSAEIQNVHNSSVGDLRVSLYQGRKLTSLCIEYPYRTFCSSVPEF